MPKPALDKFNPQPLYDIYRVTISVRDKLYGGTPKNKDIIREWIKSRTGHDDEITKAQESEVLLSDAEFEQLADSEAEKMWTGFEIHPEHGVVLRPRQVKAMLRESGTMLQLFQRKRGSKQVYQHGMEVKGMDPNYPDLIFLGRPKADGMDENAIHVMTAQGPRTALKRMDYVQDIEFSFDIWVLATSPQEKRHVGEDDLVLLLTHAQENGLGASRSQGNGKFNVCGFEKVHAGRPVSLAKSDDDAPDGEEKPKRTRSKK